MNLHRKEVKIHPMLWKLHGRQTNQLDLILTYTFAVILMIVNLTSSWKLIPWQLVIIAILSVDIGGGVISNFTKGTIKYYRKSTLSPHLFVWFHLLQTLALMLIYEKYSFQTGLISFTTMVFSSLIIMLYPTVFQRQTSIFLFALILIGIISYTTLPAPLSLLLILLAFKLMVGFARHWKKVH